MTDHEAERQAARCQQLRNRWVNENENVNRLHTRGAPAAAITAAERRREQAGAAWENAERARAGKDPQPARGVQP